MLWFNIPFDIAKQRMAQPDYRLAIEAGRQSGLGRIWETLYGLAVDKKDAGLLVLLAKEQLKLFGQVETDDVMVKSSLNKDLEGVRSLYGYVACSTNLGIVIKTSAIEEIISTGS